VVKEQELSKKLLEVENRQLRGQQENDKYEKLTQLRYVDNKYRKLTQLRYVYDKYEKLTQLRYVDNKYRKLP